MKKMNFNRKGNTLEENSNEKLERFIKKKKEKNIIIVSIIGVVLVIGGIVLYRSYALYEEKQNFDVLQGKVGDFRYDVKMAVTVDGQTVDKIPDKGLYDTTVTCNGTGQGTWDYITWNLTLAGFQTGERCLLAFTSNPNLKEEDLIANGVALRRNTYRGKNITNYWNGTEKVNGKDLYKMISDGTFEDIYVGDYIIDNNENKWLIADLDNYLYTGNDGSTMLTKHHVTVIPSSLIISAPMNNTDTTEGGYVNSKMVQEVLPSYLSTYVTPAFKDHVLTYQNLLTKHVIGERVSSFGVVGDGASSHYDWYDRQIDLMSEMNVFGAPIFSASGYDTGIDNRQYAIFRLNPSLMTSDGAGYRFNFWLKNVVNSEYFALARYRGSSEYMPASQGQGVRPRFLIG